MTQLLAWVWTPVLAYAIVLGIGLLADALLRTELPAALLAPLGMALTIVLATLGYRFIPPVLVTVAAIVLAVCGFVLARRGLRARVSTPSALIAAGAAYLLTMAPVLMSGQATWSGYNFVNDTAANFILTDLLEHHGAVAPTGVGGAAIAGRYLINVGYPLGSFSFLAVVRPLTGAPLESVYQPVISLFAAFGAMSLTFVGRRSGLRPTPAVIAAVLPFGGVLLYRYMLHGAIKEIALVALAATAVALAMVVLERRLAIRPVVLVAGVCLAMVLVFSAAATAFALALGLATLIVAFASPDRPSARHVAKLVAVAVGIGFVVALPLLGSVLDFAQNIRTVFAASGGASTGALGQLVRPLPVTEAAGVWISRDYRYPADGPFNPELVTAALVVAAAGLAYCVVRRRFGPLIFIATMVLPALVLSPLSSPYIDGKLLVVLTPAVVFLGAFVALSGLQAVRRPLRVAGGLALAALAAGVLLSDAYGYRDARLAPLRRMDAMKDVAAHVPDRGLYLLNEWEEFGKYFMGSARVNPAAESESDRPVQLVSDRTRGSRRTPLFGQWFDLDLQRLRYTRGFAGIIMRRSPAASRPPANFREIYHNHYYELWHQIPGGRVKRHLALQSRDRATAVPGCAAVRRLARQAAPGDTLVAAGRPPVARLSPLEVPHPANWPLAGDPLGTLTTAGAGVIRGTLTAVGNQRVWLRASASRPLMVYVDGRKVGQAQQIETPGQWIELGTIGLRRGVHRVEIRRPKGSWRPGDSYYGYLGPLALQSEGASRLVSVRPRDADRLCGRGWDWIELVGGRG